MSNKPRGPFGPIERLLLRAVLRLHPPSFRTKFRKEWIDFMQKQRGEDRYASPFLGTLLFWADVMRDLVVSLPRNRKEWRRTETLKRESNNGMFAVESLFLDVRFALRTLAHRPLFTVVAFLTLGLGIGAATAMFSVVDGVLLADSQYRDPDRLMSIWQTIEGRDGYTDGGEIRLQYAQYEALQEESTAFGEVAVYASDWGESTLSGDVRPELVNVGAATASLLSVLGITPVLGRWFLPEEEGEGAGSQALVTVLSQETWVRRYAQDATILGKTVVLNDNTHSVVGVLPRMDEEVRGLGAPLLLLLLSATGILLLIACGNVAALSLGEMHGRVHEVATRAAIGADQWRIVRQLISESLVLGLAGSALGALVAMAVDPVTVLRDR